MDIYDPITDDLCRKIKRYEEDIRKEQLNIAQCASRSRLYGQWRDEAILALRKYRNSDVV